MVTLPICMLNYWSLVSSVVLALPFILYAVHDRKSKANTGVTLEPINSQNAPKGHFFLHPRARSPHYIVMNDKKH